MISQTKASQYLNYLTGRTNLTAPDTVYLGICTDQPGAADGTITGEPTADSYERKKVFEEISSTKFNTFFAESEGGIIENSKEIQMATARQAWGTHYWWFLSESEKGNAYLWGELKHLDKTTQELVPGLTVNEETVPVFYAGDLKASIDVALT